MPNGHEDRLSEAYHGRGPGTEESKKKARRACKKRRKKARKRVKKLAAKIKRIADEIGLLLND